MLTYSQSPCLPDPIPNFSPDIVENLTVYVNLSGTWGYIIFDIRWHILPIAVAGGHSPLPLSTRPTSPLPSPARGTRTRQTTGLLSRINGKLAWMSTNSPLSALKDTVSEPCVPTRARRAQSTGSAVLRGRCARVLVNDPERRLGPLRYSASWITEAGHCLPIAALAITLLGWLDQARCLAMITLRGRQASFPVLRATPPPPCSRPPRPAPSPGHSPHRSTASRTGPHRS
jgi:hypothetical protein